MLHQPIIWGLGLFIILAVMIEDIPGRWSSIYLTDIGAPSVTVGWGFVAFTVAMTIGRFTGDRIIDALGERRWTRSHPGELAQQHHGGELELSHQYCYHR